MFVQCVYLFTYSVLFCDCMHVFHVSVLSVQLAFGTVPCVEVQNECHFQTTDF